MAYAPGMKASAFDNFRAFFDPDFAVNSDGIIVPADGLFDSGDSYVLPEASSSDVWFSDLPGSVQSSIIGEPYTGSVGDVFNSSDTLFDVSDSSAGLSYIFEKLSEMAEAQNQASQSSADRAMEFEKDQAELNRKFQAEQAQKAMDYQTEMSNTAYQRAMADMKAAGLNPKLVGQLGAASTPSGVAGSGAQGNGFFANMSMASASSLSNVLSTYITSANSLKLKDKDFVQSFLISLLNFFG